MQRLIVLVLGALLLITGCSQFSAKPVVVQVQRDKAGRAYTITGDASDVAGLIDRVQDQ